MKGTCKFFLQSRCAKGALCTFSHEGPASISLTLSATAPTDRAVCVYFQAGKCRNGTNCTFEHSAPLTLPTTGAPLNHLGQTTPEQPTTSTVDTRPLVVCSYYLRGSCAKGSACGYQHPAELSGQLEGGEGDSGPLEVIPFFNLQPDYILMLRQSEDAAEGLQRALLGAFVQFDQGAVIQKVTLATDFSSVRVDSMDPTSTIKSFIGIARTAGFDIKPNDVRLLPTTQEAAHSAQITIDDPTFDKRFCDKVRADPTLRVTATVVPPRLPSWAASRRINCKKVIVSWHRPTRLVWLNFGHMSVAQRVSAKFKRGQYRLSGQIVKAKEPTGKAGHHNQKGITVVLQDAPYCITRVEVFDAITSGYDKPRHVELSKTKDVYDGGPSFPVIESALLQIGPVELTDITKAGSKRFKAVALFHDENDARQAVSRLHNGKLSLQLLSSSKFRIPIKMYDAVEQEFAGHIPRWREEFLSFYIYPDSTTQRRFVTLKVEGQSVKAVAKATSTIDEIIAGKLVEIDGKPCWSNSLISNGLLFQQLKRIETACGVVIMRDKQKRHLRYFGPRHLYPATQEMICARVTADASAAHVIELDGVQFDWARRGGFKRISAALGVNVATFECTLTPKIIVTGSEQQYRQALSLVNVGAAEIITSNTRSDDEEDCAICWTPAEDPVALHCGHIYCLDCFERLCLLGDASGSDFSIECQGGAGTCKEVVESQELRNHLSSMALEGVLEVSFASYVRRRPQELRHCPGPDCGCVYRVDASAKTHTCVKCLEPVCTSCHEQHGPMSCADYKDLASGGYEAFQKFKKEMNIKDCPKCTTPIEKTMGCNHMTCSCGVHICWVCLETFQEASLCYDHLRAVHGTIAEYEDLLM